MVVGDMSSAIYPSHFKSVNNNLIWIVGVVTAEMFRHMQNSEIIRKMTEEFDEVT